MFLSPDLELDPALLAFVKCHVTSPVKWEVMRTLADQNGGWTSANQFARRTHRQPSELAEALKDLTSDGIVEVLAAPAPEDVSYRLPADEPTSVVLHRLIEMATHSQDLRAIIAAHMQHVRQQAQIVRTSTVAA
jgi:DNA-binding HxlR family transcriptional regulator